jgi:NAD(P)-dependent dehydrogenase (short-subunit alcohol dehydrogenase family)
VNAIAPGPVDTAQFRKECRENPEQFWLDAQATTALKKPVPPESVAKSILFLASESWSGNITGQILNVDSGKQGKVMWTKEEC